MLSQEATCFNKDDLAYDPEKCKSETMGLIQQRKEKEAAAKNKAAAFLCACAEMLRNDAVESAVETACA